MLFRLQASTRAWEQIEKEVEQTIIQMLKKEKKLEDYNVGKTMIIGHGLRYIEVKKEN